MRTGWISHYLVKSSVPAYNKESKRPNYSENRSKIRHLFPVQVTWTRHSSLPTMNNTTEIKGSMHQFPGPVASSCCCSLLTTKNHTWGYTRLNPTRSLAKLLVQVRHLSLHLEVAGCPCAADGRLPRYSRSSSSLHESTNLPRYSWIIYLGLAVDGPMGRPAEPPAPQVTHKTFWFWAVTQERINFYLIIFGRGIFIRVFVRFTFQGSETKKRLKEIFFVSFCDL